MNKTVFCLDEIYLGVNLEEWQMLVYSDEVVPWCSSKNFWKVWTKLAESYIALYPILIWTLHLFLILENKLKNGGKNCALGYHLLVCAISKCDQPGTIKLLWCWQMRFLRKEQDQLEHWVQNLLLFDPNFSRRRVFQMCRKQRRIAELCCSFRR